MATKKGQRIGIWIITIVMALGSIGFYFLIIIQNNEMAKQQEEIQKALQEQQEAANKPAQALPGETAATFDAASVTELKKEDLKVGEGEEVQPNAKVKVNYMGWLPDGTIFDSSNKTGTPAPIELSLDQVIQGWKDGVPGMKVGGKRKLTIPAAQAYGEQGSGKIPANTPLTFILEVVSIEK